MSGKGDRNRVASHPSYRGNLGAILADVKKRRLEEALEKTGGKIKREKGHV